MGFLARHGNKIIGTIVAVTLVLGITGTSALLPNKTTQRHHAVDIRTDMWTRLADERSARKLPPLTWNGRLSERGTEWSHFMRNNRKIFHSNLQLPPRLGLYNYLGEAIATGSKGVDSGTLFQGFMGSKAHRDMLLSAGFTSAGIGVYCGPYHGMWVTILLGRKLGEGQPPARSGEATSPTPIARPDPSNYTC